MFAQIIQGRTSHEHDVVDAFERWRADLSPSATGWLGSTGGVTDDGRFIAVVRFESQEAAMANSDLPKQDAWWADTVQHFDGDVTFQESNDVTIDVQGDPERAGFVQVMQIRSTDPERVKQLLPQEGDSWTGFRPDVIGNVTVAHDDGMFTMVTYFTSEAEAREGERKELPPELSVQMQELQSLAAGEPEFFDLKRPVYGSPA